MEIITRIVDLLNSGEFNDVVNLITEFLNSNLEYKTIDYYHFANPIEELLYESYICETDSIKKLNLNEPLDEIYMFYALGFLNLHDLDNALKYMKIANKINPVSSEILMRLCEIYQQRDEESQLKPLIDDIFKYVYDKQLLISNYFKLADYLFHTYQNMELYDHLFNFFIFLQVGESEKPVKEDIEYFKKNSVPVGFNPEIIKILIKLYDNYSKQGMINACEYFENILNEIIEFNTYLESL